MALPTTMRALRKLKSGPGEIRLTMVPVPEPGSGMVLIRVQYAAVCATDIHLTYDRFPNSPPFTLGHEFSGIVEKTGPDVISVSVGERVVSENNPGACGTCPVCRKGFPNLCPNKRAMGIHSDGAFAEYLLLPAELLHNIPDSIDSADAALMEPVAVSIHTLSSEAAVEEGDVVVVLGPGAIGLLCAQIARAKGAKMVIVAGTGTDADNRLVLAGDMGFVPVNIEKDDLQAVVDVHTRGLGADMVVEASGSGNAVTGISSLVRRAGKIAAVGITGRETVPLPWDQWISKGISAHFSYSSVKNDWKEGLHLLSEKRIQTAPLISNRFRLEEWDKAFDSAEHSATVRSLIVIGEEHEQG